MSEEEGNVLTFSELRKTQKEEDREEKLTELGDRFLLRVSNYFDKKKEVDGENSREYKNAKRVLDKIISLREEKIVKDARLSVKNGERKDDLNLLPEEQELFRRLKTDFEDHRNRIDEKVDSSTLPGSDTEPSDDVKEIGNSESSRTEDKRAEDTEEAGKDDEMEKPQKDEDSVDSEEDGVEKREIEEGYTLVRTTSEVPEFMGTDLEAYGPFDKGEEVQIPDDNAEILVNRGNAERIKDD
ncbi:MAG: hypothetical protein ABEK10_03310 [Candidatus Nanosalina sp.]